MSRRLGYEREPAGDVAILDQGITIWISRRLSFLVDLADQELPSWSSFSFVLAGVASKLDLKTPKVSRIRQDLVVGQSREGLLVGESAGRLDTRLAGLPAREPSRGRDHSPISLDDIENVEQGCRDL
jgi:hypothetical protein